MNKDFDKFMDSLATTNATLDYFTNFDKVKANVNHIELQLNQLNYLIGKEDIASAVRFLYKQCPDAFLVLEILIAVRQKENKNTLNLQAETIKLSDYLTTADGVIEFLYQTGLADIFKDRYITNLVDYVFGVEVGLDSNARKNRGGANMSKAVALLFETNHIYYKTEVNSTLFVDNIVALGDDIKRFDFVIKTSQKTYLIETNYYNSSGSKLNETARAYSNIAKKINRHRNYEFVWITDGQDWRSAKNKLQEAYFAIDRVYNLASIQQFIAHIQSQNIIANW